MNESTRRLVTAVVALAVLAAAGLGLAVVLRATERAPEGPVAVVWDREVCAHCRMHVGEPAFAAQLHTDLGEVLVFDDPGCLFEYVDAERPTVAASWFHHLREDRWIPADQVVFVRVDQSPMGYGLGAVDASDATREPTLTRDEARAVVFGGGPAPAHAAGGH